MTIITDRGLEILSKSCKLLKEANLVWCKNITDDGISFLSQNCRQLRAFRITGCDKICGVGFQGCSPTLTCFEAFDCNIDSMGVGGIVSGGGLEYLNIAASLHMYHPIGLGFGSKLKSLNLAGTFVDDNAIIEIARACSLLQEWNLSQCPLIRISGWEAIGLYCQNLENLETLHVIICLNLCDRGLLAIGAGCKRLSVIFIDTCCFWMSQSTISIFRLQRPDVEMKYEDLYNRSPSWEFHTGILDRIHV